MQLNGFMAMLYKLCEWFVRLTYATLLWYVFTLLGLLLLGFMPATVALFSIVRRLLSGETEVKVFTMFWNTYKKEFVKSNILGAILMVIGFILYIDLRVLYGQENLFLQITFIIFLMLATIYFLILLYIFPIYVNYQLKILHYIKNALIIALVKPTNTIVMVMGSFLVLYLTMIFPGIFFFFGIALLATILMWQASIAMDKIEQKREELKLKSEQE